VLVVAGTLLLLGLPRAPEGPILIFVVDTLRPDRMSAYGAARDTTPAAAALGRQAVTYLNAHALSSWTRPSIATLLTSLLPSGAGALNRWGRLDASVWYLPETLKRDGWVTAAFVSNGNLFDDRLGFQRGFDVFSPILSAATGGFDAVGREVVDPALTFIRQQRSPRFFLYVHVVDPHTPYRVEPAYRNLFGDDSVPKSAVPLDYDRSIRQADDQFARLVDALRSRGFWKAATVVYTADHGEEFLEHGEIGHGHTLFEEQIRVPLLIKYRDDEGRGTARKDPVSLADVAPTIAELYDLPVSDRWIGDSLWRRRFDADRELYFSEDADANRLYALKRGDSKLIVRLYPRFSRTFFSLDRDPGEQNGLDLPCGAEPPDPGVIRTLWALRRDDVAAFPSLRYDGGAGAGGCQMIIDVSRIPKPFLTAEDHCRHAEALEAGRLFIRDAPHELSISADDRGRLAAVDFVPGEARCGLERIESRLLEGSLTEEYLKRLRALGYLQ
jgi:arylsulfatase A-like enzyme